LNKQIPKEYQGTRFSNITLSHAPSEPVFNGGPGTAALRNPLTIAAWGLIVATLLLIGSPLPFVGLAVVMPVLGHSTWHLYRKLVEPDPRPRSEPPRRPRYAAQFPAVLFAGENRP